ncbi:MAG: TonB-dependent receptor [Proteobacteria bacterium]|jgi:iron complex outermembrane receptor protein|nr:TonB-dependent receptor [Pseudomonadota bacterium]
MKPTSDDRGPSCIHTAVRLAITLGALSASLATAQDADTALEEVIVTGSRIAVANMTSTSPILTVSSDDMKIGGRMDITDMLNQLPQVNANYLGQDIGNRTSGLSSAGGVATASLRGLGPSRTLVLVDGRRLGAGSPQTSISAPGPDIDQIPAALVERVEVVTGGASAVYGSDAIAGVINFITRRNFEGLQLDAQLGGNWHSNSNGFARQKLADAGESGPRGSDWDGKAVNASLTAGANILEGRGNVTGYFAYQKMDPVRSSDRDFGSCQLSYNDDLDDLVCQGSSNSNYFGPRPGNAAYSVKGDQFVPRTTTGLAPPAFFNSQGYIYMQRGNERYNAGFVAHVDVNDLVKPYAEFSFMNDRTHQEVAPTALFRGSQVLTDTGNYKVNCSNPLLSAQQASLLCTPQQIAADLLNPGSASADVEIGRRNVEGGGRTYDFEHTNYRLALGTKGRIAEGWSYDTYGQYYYTSFSSINGKDFSFDKIANALQVTGTAAAPRCITGGACVPYNIFADGGVTQQSLDYLETLGTATGNTELRTFHADVTGDLGVYGLKLPTADDGVGMNVGYEYRKERVRYVPDAAFESGLIVGTGGASPRIGNALAVKEGFAEVRVPLVQGRPGIHDLLVDAGYRYSDYSSGVTTDTYKFELQYAPVADYRFRASYNRAIRAPTIVELFVPQLVGKIAFGEDPCAPGETTGVAAESLAKCLNTGVTAAQYGNGGTTNTIPQGTAGQLTQLQGGNPDLSPERADTYTVGLTLQPAALPNFTGSIDYYRIKLEDAVGALDAQIIMRNCLDTGDPTYCSQIRRQPLTGTLNGASVGGGGYIVQTNVNIGSTVLEGIDLQAGYRFGLGEYGTLRLLLNGAYQLSNTTTPLPGGGSYDCVGLFGPTCQTVNPRWRHTARASWAPRADLSINATWRFLGGVKLDNNDPNPLLLGSALGGVATFRAKMPAVSYLDLAATWEPVKQLQIRGGISNVFDRDPPLTPSELVSGGAPNYYEFYDGLGRQVFLAMTAKF